MYKSPLLHHCPKNRFWQDLGIIECNKPGSPRSASHLSRSQAFTQILRSVSSLEDIFEHQGFELWSRWNKTSWHRKSIWWKSGDLDMEQSWQGHMVSLSLNTKDLGFPKLILELCCLSWYAFLFLITKNSSPLKPYCWQWRDSLVVNSAYSLIEDLGSVSSTCNEQFINAVTSVRGNLMPYSNPYGHLHRHDIHTLKQAHIHIFFLNLKAPTYVCDSMHKTCANSSSTKFQHGEERRVPSPTPSQGATGN